MRTFTIAPRAIDEAFAHSTINYFSTLSRKESIIIIIIIIPRAEKEFRAAKYRHERVPSSLAEQ